MKVLIAPSGVITDMLLILNEACPCSVYGVTPDSRIMIELVSYLIAE